MLAPYRYCPPTPAADGTYTSHAGLATVLTPELAPADAWAYDQFVAMGPGVHYSQTRAWAPVAAAGKPFVPLYFLARRKGHPVGAALLLRTRLGGIAMPVAQAERGPVCSADDLPDVLQALRRACLGRGIARLSVMPYGAGDARGELEKTLREQGFTDVQRPAGRHVRTLRIDLDALDSHNLFGAPFLSKVRQNIGRAQRAGATGRRGRHEDLAAFRAMEEAAAAQQGHRPPAPVWYEAIGDYFLRGGRGAMFVSEAEGEVISAVFVTLHDGVATYVVGASSTRPLKFSKTVLAMAEALQWARHSGAHTFDMGGIPMAGDTDAKRAAIAEFKFSYSRTAVDLVHEHVRWF